MLIILSLFGYLSFFQSEKLEKEQQPEWIRLLTLIPLLVSQSNTQPPERIGW